MPIWVVSLLRVMWPYLLAGVVGLGVVGYLYQKGKQAEREAAFRREVAAYQAEVLKANQIAVGLESTLANLRVENQQLNERLRDETARDPVYRDCVLPVGGVQLLNRALQGTAAR